MNINTLLEKHLDILNPYLPYVVFIMHVYVNFGICVSVI